MFQEQVIRTPNPQLSKQNVVIFFPSQPQAELLSDKLYFVIGYMGVIL